MGTVTNYNNYFNFGAAGLVAGVWLGTFVDWDLNLAGLFLVIAIGLVILDKKYLAISLLCLGFTLGLTRIYAMPTASVELAERVGEKVELTGVLVAEPDERDTQTLLTIKVKNSTTKVLLTVPPYLPAGEAGGNYEYGDVLKITGKIDWPKSFTTETGKIFDYQKYLAKDNIFFTSYQPEIVITGHNRGNIIIAKLLALKKFLVSQIAVRLPEPESSLLAGLLVGEKQALGKKLNDDFRVVGLSHIVVLSGYNLSLVANYILGLVSIFLPLHLALGAGAFGIVLFALMVGAGATVFRASLMALLALLARATGRVYEATIALFAAGVIMLLWNPKVLVYDLGFQLSFLATLGVIHGPVLLSPYFKKVPERFLRFFPLREIVLTTVSAQIIVLPWILYTTGNLSLVALPANVLVLPFIPLTMLFGFLTAFVSPLSLVAHWLLSYILLVVKILSSLPLAAVTVSHFPLVLTIVCYVLIFYWSKKKLCHHV